MAKQKTQADTSSITEADGEVGAVGVVLNDASADSSTAESDQSNDEHADAAPKTVQARVLAHCAFGEPNDVIEIDAAEAATVTDMVDTTPEAVAYALSISE